MKNGKRSKFVGGQNSKVCPSFWNVCGLFKLTAFCGTLCASVPVIASTSFNGLAKVGVEVRQTQKQIKGKVLDAAGEPVIGANIKVKGTTIGTISDMDGGLCWRWNLE